MLHCYVPSHSLASSLHVTAINIKDVLFVIRLRGHGRLFSRRRFGGRRRRRSCRGGASLRVARLPRAPTDSPLHTTSSKGWSGPGGPRRCQGSPHAGTASSSRLALPSTLFPDPRHHTAIVSVLPSVPGLDHYSSISLPGICSKARAETLKTAKFTVAGSFSTRLDPPPQLFEQLPHADQSDQLQSICKLGSCFWCFRLRSCFSYGFGPLGRPHHKKPFK